MAYPRPMAKNSPVTGSAIGSPGRLCLPCRSPVWWKNLSMSPIFWRSGCRLFCSRTSRKMLISATRLFMVNGSEIYVTAIGATATRAAMAKMANPSQLRLNAARIPEGSDSTQNRI